MRPVTGAHAPCGALQKEAEVAALKQQLEAAQKEEAALRQQMQVGAHMSGLGGILPQGPCLEHASS
jgi:hypothetical protein